MPEDCKRIDCCNSGEPDLSTATPICDTRTQNPVFDEFGDYTFVQAACTFEREESESVLLANLLTPLSVKTAFADAFSNPFSYYAGGKWELIVVIEGEGECQAENSIGGGTITPEGDLEITHRDDVEFPADNEISLNNDFSLSFTEGTCDEGTAFTAYMVFRCSDLFEATRSDVETCPENTIGDPVYDVATYESAWNQETANDQALYSAQQLVSENFDPDNCVPEVWALWIVTGNALRLFNQRTDLMVNSVGIGAGIAGVVAVTTDMDQTVYYGNASGEINKCNANTQAVSSVGTGYGNISGVAIGPDENLYAYDKATNTLHQINKATGAILGSKVIVLPGVFNNGPTEMVCDSDLNLWMMFGSSVFGTQSHMLGINWTSGTVDKDITMPDTTVWEKPALGPNGFIATCRTGGGAFGGPAIAIIDMANETIDSIRSEGGIVDYYTGIVLGTNAYVGGAQTFSGNDLAQLTTGGTYSAYNLTTEVTPSGLLSSVSQGKMYRIDGTGNVCKFDISGATPTLDFQNVPSGTPIGFRLSSDAMLRHFVL